MADIVSPCKGICTHSDKYKICIGCFRTKLEIIMWHRSTDKSKLQVIKLAASREKLYGNILQTA